MFPAAGGAKNIRNIRHIRISAAHLNLEPGRAALLHPEPQATALTVALLVFGE